MKYSSPTTLIGKPLGGLFPNLLYSFLNSDWIGAADYSDDCNKDPCLITGIDLFVAGFIINRYVDLSLLKLRTNYSEGTPFRMAVYLKSYHTLTILVQCWNGLVGLWELGPYYSVRFIRR